MDASKKDLEHKVNQLMKVAKAAAEGDLTVSVAVRGDDDMGRLGEALCGMISDLKSVISQVQESANQFAEGSRVVAESANYLSESAQNQAATVEEMLGKYPAERSVRTLAFLADFQRRAGKLAAAKGTLAEARRLG